MRFVSKIIAPLFAAASLVTAGAASAIEPLDGRGLAPYRFNPPPHELSPPQDALGHAYRSRLQNKLTELERRQLRRSPLGQEQLRDARRELNRVERLLDIR